MALNKITIERNQRTLLDLVALPGNDVCADCKVKNPRWASHSLGIFICVSCASIHRKIGTHVTKVKSITMDSWTREQTENMRQNGNIKSNQYYNPNESRHPPPPNLMDGERDSEMEQFVRSKYEYKSFIDRSAVVAAKLGPSRSATSLARTQTIASSSNGNVATAAANAPAAPPARSGTMVLEAPKAAPSRSMSQPLPAASRPQAAPPQPQPQPQPAQQPAGGVWNDLISLQAPASSSSLPLQFQPSQNYAQQPPMNGFQQPQMANPTGMGMGMGMGGMPAGSYQQAQFVPGNSYTPQMQQQQQQQPQFTPSFSSPSYGGAAPLYNPQPQPFAPQQQQQQQQQQLFQGQPVPTPIAQGGQGYGFQPPAQATYGSQMLGPGPGQGQFGSPSPHPPPFMSGSPHPPQFVSGSPQPFAGMSGSPQQFAGMSGSPQPFAGMSGSPQQFAGMSGPPQPQPQPHFQQFGGGGGMQGQQWMGGGGMGYVPQQQQGQWGGM
ncbi:hypothetical protein B0H10DRAFT_2165269 [Mycena sp. CBHHK59/15]|nr:hypothetical protein B0H10DRAFT_2165269 [Mycena sp. CBHHK59/15]